MFDVRGSLEGFYTRSLRVLRISYRPQEKEYRMIVKTTGLGILLIGLIGFVISLIFRFI